MCSKKWTLKEARKHYFSNNTNRRCVNCKFVVTWSNRMDCKVKDKKCYNADAVKCKYFTAKEVRE